MSNLKLRLTVYGSGTRIKFKLNKNEGIIIKTVLCYKNVIYHVSYINERGEYTVCELYEFEFDIIEQTGKINIGFHKT
jgi:hypothetical protein